MVRDWDTEWQAVEAEHRAAKAGAVDITGLSSPQEVEAFQQANERFRAAVERRMRFVEDRQRAEPRWSPPAVPV